MWVSSYLWQGWRRGWWHRHYCVKCSFRLYFWYSILVWGGNLLFIRNCCSTGALERSKNRNSVVITILFHQGISSCCQMRWGLAASNGRDSKVSMLQQTNYIENGGKGQLFLPFGSRRCKLISVCFARLRLALKAETSAVCYHFLPTRATLCVNRIKCMYLLLPG